MARGFQYGTGGPGDLVIGWNGGHTAVTLPDGTPVSSGEHGGVHIGGAGAYQPQFTHHMHLPMSADTVEGEPEMLGPGLPGPETPAPELPAPETPAPDALPSPELPAPDALPAPEPVVVPVEVVTPDAPLAPEPAAAGEFPDLTV